MDNRVCVIDTSGNEIIELPAKEGRTYVTYLGENLVSFEEKEKFGLINLDGKVILKPKYNKDCYGTEGISRFRYGLALVSKTAKVTDHAKVGVINAKGKEVVALGKYSSVVVLGEDMLGVKKTKKDNKIVFVTLKGKALYKDQYASYYDVERVGDMILCETDKGTCGLYYPDYPNSGKYLSTFKDIKVGYQSQVFYLNRSSDLVLWQFGPRTLVSQGIPKYSWEPKMNPDTPYIIWKKNNEYWVVMDSNGNVLF